MNKIFATKRQSGFLTMVLLVILILFTVAPTPVVYAASNCTPGRQVDKNAFFTAVAQKLINPTMPGSAVARAVQAFIIWEPYENTNACWNPLATTLPRSGSTSFNSAGVQSYPDFDSGVQATVDTINYTFNGQGAYYAPIRKMMALQGFDESAIKTSLKGWVGSESYSSAVTAKWKSLYAGGGTPPTVFASGAYSSLTQDQNWGRANLKVCAPNLPGNTVYVFFNRNGRSWEYNQTASSTCVTFWDMDGAGPMNKATTYYSRAALNQKPDPNWPAPNCAGPTGGKGLCDSIRRP